MSTPSASQPVPISRIVTAAAVVVAMLLTTLLAVLLGGHRPALAIPASVDGLPLMHGPGADAIADQIRVRVQEGTQELLVGAYGQSQSPAFIFTVRDSGGGLSGFETAYVRNVTSGLRDPGTFVHVTRDGIGYDCATVRTETTTPLTFCFFDDGRALGAGLVPDSASIDRALRLTSLARQGTESG